MEVTIKKVKLTKSIVSQMEFLEDNALKDATVVGMLINVRKKYPKVALLEFRGDYYLYDLRWLRGEKQFYFSIGGWSHSKKFNS